MKQNKVIVEKSLNFLKQLLGYRQTWYGLILFVLLCLILAWRVTFPPYYETFKDLAPAYSTKIYPVPVLLRTTVSPNQLSTELKFYKTCRISGFIIPGPACTTENPAAELKAMRSACKKINLRFSRNYLELTIATSNIPNWDQLEDWKILQQKISQIAKFAQETGFQGLVLDTTAYDPRIWNPEYDYENPRYKTISEDFASSLIYQRSREMIQSIDKAFPQAEIYIRPLGPQEPTESYKTMSNYEYWKHFANGVQSTQRAKGFTFIANTAEVNNSPNVLQALVVSANNIIYNELDEKEYNKLHGKLSLALNPYTKRYSYIEWQTEPDFLFNLMVIQQQAQNFIVVNLPPDSDTEATHKLLSNIAKLYDPNLKAYFEKVKTGHSPLYLKYLYNRVYTFLRRFI